MLSAEGMCPNLNGLKQPAEFHYLGMKLIECLSSPLPQLIVPSTNHYLLRVQEFGADENRVVPLDHHRKLRYRKYIFSNEFAARCLRRVAYLSVAASTFWLHLGMFLRMIDWRIRLVVL